MSEDVSDVRTQTAPKEHVGMATDRDVSTVARHTPQHTKIARPLKTTTKTACRK